MSKSPPTLPVPVKKGECVLLRGFDCFVIDFVCVNENSSEAVSTEG